MIVKCNVLDRQYKLYKKEYDDAALRVLESGWYVLGEEVRNFENEFSKHMKREYCVGLNSGLDALTIAIRLLGIGVGEEVIVQSNAYIASVLAITNNNATPVFVEPDEYYSIDVAQIERNISSRTKAILVVHLYGQSAKMDEIMEIANKYKLYVIEDCAQSHESSFDGKMTGTFGIIGCFSFYPTKNLGAFGDAGCIVTDNKEIEEKARAIRNYGSKEKYQNEVEGVNSRLDEIQAALLRVKLNHIQELTNERYKLGKRYIEGISNPRIEVPRIRENANHVFHQFVIKCSSRDDFRKYLDDNGIQTQIHYPIPPHLSECYFKLGYKKGDFPIAEDYAGSIVSLPIYSGMTLEEQEYVIDVVNKYRK